MSLFSGFPLNHLQKENTVGAEKTVPSQVIGDKKDYVFDPFTYCTGYASFLYILLYSCVFHNSSNAKAIIHECKKSRPGQTGAATLVGGFSSILNVLIS
jgi:hypothetical protein